MTAFDREDREQEIVVTCLPGLEPMLRQELIELGCVDARPRGVGRVVVRGRGWRDVFEINLRSGLAVSVLVEVARFGASRLPELRRKAGNLEWGEWLAAGTQFAVRARCKKSKIYHSGAVASRFAEALVEHGCEDHEDGVPLLVQIERNSCAVFLDTSGEPLHRRGWRLATAKAPLRPDLARALVLASGWGGDCAFVDPFCGSGTIAIEAAGWARRLAPGRLRSFAFERLVGFDATAWNAARDAAIAQQAERVRVSIHASDRDAGGIEAAVSNADRAGVADDIDFVRCAFSAAHPLEDPSEAGVIVSNPPYGKRVGAAPTLRDLYARFGAIVRRLPAAWRCLLLAGDVGLARHTGLGAEPVFSTEHGGLRVTALRTDQRRAPHELA